MDLIQRQIIDLLNASIHNTVPKLDYSRDVDWNEVINEANEHSITGLIYPALKNIKDNNISIPENLYIIGTVNMDDTTFSFSRKVLDRANTIEFSEVDLETLDFLTGEAETLVVDNSLLKTQFLNIKDALEIDRTYVEEINEKIVEINNILKPYSKHFGYRVRDEIVFYMLENKLANLLEEDMLQKYYKC